MDCGFTQITIPSKVTSIGECAFGWCTSLTSIFLKPKTPPTIDDPGITFAFVDKKRCTLYVPIGTYEKYRNDEQWGKFANIEEFDYSSEKFNLTYILDGKELATEKYAEGDTIQPYNVPAKEGYTFTGWNNLPVTMPAHDIEVTGSYAANTYKLTYMVDGVCYKESDVAYGTAITAEPAPIREGYTFSGWDAVPTTMPAKDVVISGTFSINSYKLTVYVDGEVYLEKILEYGSAVTVATPEFGDGRKFNGWDIEIPTTMPAHDVVIHGTTSLETALTSVSSDLDERLTVYALNGKILMRDVTARKLAHGLKPGVYIINGKKCSVK